MSVNPLKPSNNVYPNIKKEKFNKTDRDKKRQNENEENEKQKDRKVDIKA